MFLHESQTSAGGQNGKGTGMLVTTGKIQSTADAQARRANIVSLTENGWHRQSLIWAWGSLLVDGRQIDQSSNERHSRSLVRE